MKMPSQFFKKSIFISLFPITLAYSTHSFSGFDVSCYPSTNIQTNAYTACDNLPALTPANDNQTNMLLLLSDMGLAKLNFNQPNSPLWETEYSNVPFAAKTLFESVTNKRPNARLKPSNVKTPYQEHCSSLDNGADQFTQQVKADKNLNKAEKDLLIQERQNISACDRDLALIQVNPNWSIQARQYASYLNATIAFYNSNFSTATKIYSVLTTVDQPWIKETSQYMLIRSSLNESYQSGVGKYGDLKIDKVDQTLLKNTYEHITTYFKRFPEGKYAASARGLLRRCYWLSGNTELLTNELAWQINHPDSKYYNLELDNLVFEIDRHVFQSRSFNAKNLKDPFFLTISDLMQMRQATSAEDKVLSWSELNNQKTRFKSQPELFQYLQANHLFFVQNKPAEALKYLPEHSSNSINSYLQLSQILLKGRILEKLGQTQNAQQYWEGWLSQSKSIEQRGLFELMLYPHYAQQQSANLFIGSNAKIKQASLQKSFIENEANEKSLMQIVQSKVSSTDQKNLALYKTLQKSLVHQNFKLFNQAFVLLPQDAAKYKYDSETYKNYKNQPPFSDFIWVGTKITPQMQCPDLFSLTQKLENSPQDLKLRLCLGEYARSTQGYNISYVTALEKETSSFQGAIFTRGQVYKDIIKSSSVADLKAYALYRSIMCYSPSGMNDCQDAEVEKSTRKQWFDHIKRDYPSTSWAQSLKYYW